MVEVSNLYDLDIYTITGQYVGRVVDVVLNMRMGTIAKLQVKALEPENKNVGIRDIFRNGLQFVPEENEMRAFQEGVLNVDFDKVRAIGDIMLIDPQDIQRQTQATQNHQQGQVPNREPQQPTQ
ncbi:hypothetical protein SDC9_03531 [bioreactor metagenome]|uniref:PRC-barrel domain-containing protein n=2 Tax=root TaxID=1 RepID=A0A644STP4_9ZZZZ|nr:PRC-barrel domain-containing protein [Methanobrevibacter sp.]MEA4956150.1 PRC-barrel domain-containing protein [Methanobrevibacter sp.]